MYVVTLLQEGEKAYAQNKLDSSTIIEIPLVLFMIPFVIAKLVFPYRIKIDV